MTPATARVETTKRNVQDPSGRRQIDVVFRADTDESRVEELARRLGAIFDLECAYDWTRINVDNGSADRNWELGQGISTAKPRSRVVRLARNTNLNGGLTARSDYATGDACVFMTADLQDQPEAIPGSVRMWEDGYDSVYGRATERQGTELIQRLASQPHWLASWMSGGRLTRDASDFRLMDHRLHETPREMDERNRILRGFVAWTRFPPGVDPVAQPPLLISAVGVVASFVAVLSFLCNVWRACADGLPFAGYGTITSLLLRSFGMLVLMLGVIAETIGLTYEEVEKRPHFVVRENIGLPTRDCRSART